MYFIKETKRIFLDSKYIVFLFASLILYILSFLSMKNQYFFEIVNYIPTYINKYADKFLGSDISQLISNNKIWIYVENDVEKIFSSIYLFFTTQQSIFYTIIMILVPIAIFYFINKHFYDELHSKFFKNITYRIGTKKYIFTKITTMSLYGGSIALLPKLLYFGILSIFYVDGYSLTHFLSNSSFVQEQYMFFQTNFNPMQFLILDLLMTFGFGILVSLISMIVVVCSERKILSYLLFIFIIAMQCILSIILLSSFNIFVMTPIIYMFSAVQYLFFDPTVASASSIITQYGVLFILLLIILTNNFNKKLRLLL